MIISIRKKYFMLLGFVMGNALLSNQSCEHNKKDVCTIKNHVEATDKPHITFIEEQSISNKDSIAELCELIADLFEGKNSTNANESITDIIQKGEAIVESDRPTFNNYMSKERVDKLLSVFEKIKAGIRSGYFYNDSTWYGKLPGPRLKEMANLLKEFITDLPAATRKRLTVGKLQQLAMLQVLIKRLSLENVVR